MTAQPSHTRLNAADRVSLDPPERSEASEAVDTAAEDYEYALRNAVG